MGLVAYYFNCLIYQCLFYILFHLFLPYSRQHTVFIFNVNYSLLLYGPRVRNKQLYNLQLQKNWVPLITILGYMGCERLL